MGCAAAQVCKEAGGRVSTNVFVRDLDLAAFNALDNRRVEVIADGFPLWHGAPLAIDTTLVSPLRGDGSARGRAADHSGSALQDPDGGRRGLTLNSQAKQGEPVWWFLPRRWAAGVSSRQSEGGVVETRPVPRIGAVPSTHEVLRDAFL